MNKVVQNRIYTPYITACLVVSLPKRLCVHRIYVWFWPTLRIHKMYMTVHTRWHACYYAVYAPKKHASMYGFGQPCTRHSLIRRIGHSCCRGLNNIIIAFRLATWQLCLSLSLSLSLSLFLCLMNYTAYEQNALHAKIVHGIAAWPRLGRYASVEARRLLAQ